MSKEKTAAAPKPEFKYTVDNLAEDLDIQPQSVRIALRKHGVEKSGKQYGWNNQKDYQAVLKKLKGDDDKPKAKAA